MSASFRFDYDKYILVCEGADGYQIVKEEDVKKLDPSKYIIGLLPNRTPSRDVFDIYFHKQTRKFICALRLNEEPPPQPYWRGRLDFTSLGPVNCLRRTLGQLNRVYVEKSIIPEYKPDPEEAQQQVTTITKKMKRVHFDLDTEQEND